MRSNNAPAMLQQLHLAELERAQALEDDIGLLLPSSYRDPSAENVPCLRSFERHIKDSLAKKPHLLVAYTWIFYMALFSGGRYIRAKLRAGLDSFIASIEVGKTTGLTFWEFPGEKDGEDLKVEYKKRVSALSAQLTDEERAEIVEESIHIMTTLTNVVREVAEIVPSRAIALSLEAPAGGIHGPVARIRPPWLLLLGILFPFGIMEIMFAALGSWKSQAPEQGVVAPMPAPLKAE
ncbi:MAG: hypothetical protein L6R39_001566 [Caloplaca ligustica]|nr:MAG: hypothetical protein L6R39_001566 [Caloplaca ligustica]